MGLSHAHTILFYAIFGTPPPTGYAANNVSPHVPGLLLRFAGGDISSRMYPFSPHETLLTITLR